MKQQDSAVPARPLWTRWQLPFEWRDASFAVFIVGILGWGAGVALYTLARADVLDVVLRNADDAFYYFQIAWNLADGKFSTFDGGITRTNGYHPLWMFLITPFYWIFDKETALFAIKALEFMLVAGAVALTAGAARLTRQPWILFFATLPALYGYPLTDGMEAAAALFMLGLFFIAICLYARDAARWTPLLAAVAFALPWARLEYVAISLISTVALWVFVDRDRAAPATASSSKPFWLGSIPTIGALAGLLVYFAYNWAAFGGIVPVSGATKAAWAHLQWADSGGFNILRALSETMELPVFDSGLAVAAEVCVYFLLVWRLDRRFRGAAGRGLLTFLICVASLSAFHIVQFIQLSLLGHPHNIPGWYHAPGYMMMACIVPVRCLVAIYLITLFVEPKSARLANISRKVVFLAGAAVLFATVDFKAPFRLADYFSNPSDNGYIGFSQNQWRMGFVKNTFGAAQIANRVLPEGSIIGSWDAGVMGYFSRFPVVNLDGLVNSWDYFRAIVSDDNLAWWPASASHILAAQLELYREIGISHIYNIYPASDKSPGLGNVIHIEPAPYDSGFWLTSLDPLDGPDAGNRFWEKMKPHFESTHFDMGVVVEARWAYAVARRCEPDDLVFFRWESVSRRRDSAFGRLNETPTGVCTDVVILPQDAASAVSIESGNNIVERMIRDRLPEARSDFDVYMDSSEQLILYTKRKCVEEDVEKSFFLHLVPTDPGVLSKHRTPVGFDNLDFNFERHGQRMGEACVAVRQLPGYPIAAVHTGQYEFADGEFRHIWEVSFEPSDSADKGGASP